jgi:AcrR family transcriptional regulator
VVAAELDNHRYDGWVSAVSAPTTRERLMAAAIEVFLSDGYERARVHDVARAAGMTTGAIYANYRGKAELLFDAITDRADLELDGLLEGTASHETRELLGVLGDRLVQPRRQPALLLEAIVAARRDDTLGALLRERLGAREQLVARLIEQGKADGSIDPGLDTEVLARFCVTLALGALAVRSLELDPAAPEEWHSLIARLLDACAPAGEST